MHNIDVNRFQTSHMWFFVKLALCAFCAAIFKFYGGDKIEEIPATVSNAIATPTVENETKIVENLTVEAIANEEIKPAKKILYIIKRQPACSVREKLLILDQICSDLQLKKMGCRPEDIHNPLKHKIPKNTLRAKNESNSETQGAVVNYLIAILLLTSLSAALLELYRAKRAQKPSSEPERRGFRVPLNRKCSLADLTVMKHHRKELVRRESVLDQTREENVASMQGRIQGRPPMRVD